MHTEKEIKEAIGYFNGLENRLFNENAEKPAYNNGFEGGIKALYKFYGLKFHPDKKDISTEASEENFKELKRHYEVLEENWERSEQYFNQALASSGNRERSVNAANLSPENLKLKELTTQARYLDTGVISEKGTTPQTTPTNPKVEEVKIQLTVLMLFAMEYQREYKKYNNQLDPHGIVVFGSRIPFSIGFGEPDQMAVREDSKGTIVLLFWIPNNRGVMSDQDLISHPLVGFLNRQNFDTWSPTNVTTIGGRENVCAKLHKNILGNDKVLDNLIQAIDREIKNWAEKTEALKKGKKMKSNGNDTKGTPTQGNVFGKIKGFFSRKETDLPGEEEERKKQTETIGYKNY